jgi:hypothetical protein
MNRLRGCYYINNFDLEHPVKNTVETLTMDAIEQTEVLPLHRLQFLQHFITPQP